ncbi:MULTISPECIES: pilus assembly protein TadG-related protein [unclassified Variovorax]|nr:MULTISPECIES: pilus assembly protein TadG-related protein [unclassified Variovorax]
MQNRRTRTLLHNRLTPCGARSRERQRGGIAVLTIVSMVVLLAFAGLAIDIGHLFVARNELQNAADSGSLAGANYLYRPGVSPGSSYDWSSAQSNAVLAVKKNAANGPLLVDADAITGYWDGKCGPSPATPCSSAFKTLPFTPPANSSYVPAVKVTVEKKSGKNGGPVGHFLLPLVGAASSTVAATSVAVSASPDTVLPGGLMPLVVSKCRYDASWDFSQTPPRPRLQNGNPIRWYVGSGTPSNGNPACSQDQSLFTSFDNFNNLSNNASAMRDLFDHGNPHAMRIGDNTMLLDQADGIAPEFVRRINSCSAAGNRTCEYVTVLVVAQSQNAVPTKITGFACLHILSGTVNTSGGNGNYYVTVELSTLCQNNSSAGLSQPNAVYRVRLVQ